MTILRKFIIKEWLKSFTISMLVLFLLITIVSLLTGFLRENVTPLEVILNHLIQIPSFFDKILPISCLTASLFSINKLKDRNELTAIFAAGFSRKNYILSILFVSFLVASLQFFLNSFAGPYLKLKKEKILPGGEKKFKNLNNKGLRGRTKGTGKVWYKGDNYFFNFSTFDKQKFELINFSYYGYNKQHLLQHKVTAKKLKFYKHSSPTAIDGISYRYLAKAKTPQVKDFDHLLLNITQNAEDLMQIESDVTALNINELYQFIKQLQNSGINSNEYLVTFYNKFSSAIICILFSLLSCTSIFNPNRRGGSSGKSIFLILIFTLVYWLIFSYSIQLGTQSKVDPFIACFFVPFLFLLFLINIFYRNRKLI